MAGYDIVVIGASAGGLAPLRTIVRGLPADFPAAVCVVRHVLPTYSDHLPAILGRGSALPAEHASDGGALRPGHIYIAPSDRHLLIAQRRAHLAGGPHQDHWRPSINAMFRSAAHSYGGRVIGVVLSGMLYDGTAGLAAIKRNGGLAVVQDPADAEYPNMPRDALHRVAVDYVLPAGEIAPLLVHLTAQPDGAKREGVWDAGAASSGSLNASMPEDIREEELANVP